jgi:hypothetical protein
LALGVGALEGLEKHTMWNLLSTFVVYEAIRKYDGHT